MDSFCEGVLLDVDVGSTGSESVDTDAVLSGAMFTVLGLASSTVADCVGSGKVSSPRSCTSLSAALR